MSDPGLRWGRACSTTASTSGVSPRHIRSMSTDDARSVRALTATAPASTRAVVLLAVRFHTVSGNPALTRLVAIPEPIMPSPINPSEGVVTSLYP